MAAYHIVKPQKSGCSSSQVNTSSIPGRTWATYTLGAIRFKGKIHGQEGTYCEKQIDARGSGELDVRASFHLASKIATTNDSELLSAIPKPVDLLMLECCC